MDRKNIQSNDTWYSKKNMRNLLLKYILYKGSLRGSVLTLISTSLGAGVLALPKTLEECGLVLGLVLLVIGGCLALWSMYMLMDIAIKT